MNEEARSAPDAPMLDAGSLEQRYSFLDDCPEDLLHDVVAMPFGSLEERVAGVRLWRDSLLEGRLPPPDAWPPPAVAAPVRRALEDMGLVRFCRAQAELVDVLLKDIMASFRRHGEVIRDEVAARLRELDALERRRLEDLERSGDRKRNRRDPVRLDESTRRRLRAQAEAEVVSRIRAGDRALIAAWEERARIWSELADVFGDLGDLMGRGWDLAQGVLRHTGWLEVLRLRELVEKLPQLREVIRALGRLHDATQETSVAEKLLVPVRRLEEERREIATPFIPAETRGIERSGEISRMLPVEASMLGHPKLRLLWHARRAERALLTYRVEGIEVEHVAVEREGQAEVERKARRPERGPIIAIIDTSGSMQGTPEQVAKAIVLEALRTAHAEKRRCFVYAFSGPGEVMELELALSADGIGRLLEFLGFSFGGGSDETGVMTKVLARLKQEQWRKADVLFVSDGEWPVPDTLVAQVRAAREHGNRLHGVQIGNFGKTGLHAVCDPVHEFRDWAEAGGWS